MSETPKEITLIDILFDESLLRAYAQQEYRKFKEKQRQEREERKQIMAATQGYYPFDTEEDDDNEYFIPTFIYINPLIQFENIYWDWKETVCKICEPNRKKERYYRKIAIIERRKKAGMTTIRPQLGFRERYPKAFADDDPSAPDYGKRITMADVLADDTLLDLWTTQQWHDNSIEEAKQRFLKFRDELVSCKEMPPMQILRKFRKDKIRATGIDPGYFDVANAKEKYPDFFCEDDPESSCYPGTITIAYVFVRPELVTNYCQQTWVHIYGTTPVREVIEKTRKRVEELRKNSKVPDRQELLRYKIFRERLRKKHNIHFSANGIIQG